MRAKGDKTCRDRMTHRRFAEDCTLRGLLQQEPIDQSISLRQRQLSAFHRLDQP
jgi:hypothetical protein